MTTHKRGRPPGSRNERTILADIARRKVRVAGPDGGKRAVTLLELLIQQLVKLATTDGDVAATTLLRRVYESSSGEREDGLEMGMLLVPATLSDAEWMRRERIRNQHRRPPVIADARTPADRGAIDVMKMGSTSAPPINTTPTPWQPPQPPPPPRYRVYR